MIPAGRMKGTLIAKEMGADHAVPLSTQVIALLEELEPFTADTGCCSPGCEIQRRPHERRNHQ